MATGRFSYLHFKDDGVETQREYVACQASHGSKWKSQDSNSVLWSARLEPFPQSLSLPVLGIPTKAIAIFLSQDCAGDL